MGTAATWAIIGNIGTAVGGASAAYGAVTAKSPKIPGLPQVDEEKKRRQAERSAKRRRDQAIGAYGSNKDVAKSGLAGGTGAGQQNLKTLLG